ncbi:MAG: thiamine phosphate synthase [Clostridia bacterium]|nr:thiamine phosphate synthase [Clostridia bacterium]
MLFVITSSNLCTDNFLSRIDSIAKAKPDRIILREKHLSSTEYMHLALECKTICEKYSVPFLVNSFYEVAEKIGVSDIHIPLSVLEEKPSLVSEFKTVGVSVHSVVEAQKAEKLGSSYVIFGHIFPTDCKKDLAPRGTDLLKEVVSSVDIPVLAIGGITKERISDVMSTGTKGICVMSHFMKCKNPYEEITDFKNIIEKV